MKVTIALITYNRPTYLKLAITAILNQTYTDFEFLILDNGSAETTKKIILEFKDKRIRYIRNEINDRDFYNRAFYEAKGEYLLITHDDDIMLPDLVSKEVSTLDKYPESIVVACNACSIDEYDNITNSKILKLKKVNIFNKYQFISNIIRDKNGIICPTAFLRKEFFLKHNYTFDMMVGPAADNYMWFKCNLSDKSLIILPDILYKYRIHKNQDSTINNISMNTKFYEALLLLFTTEKLYDIIPIITLRIMINYSKSLHSGLITKVDYIEKISQLSLHKNNFFEKGLLNLNKYLLKRNYFLTLQLLKLQNRIRIIFFDTNYFKTY